MNDTTVLFGAILLAVVAFVWYRTSKQGGGNVFDLRQLAEDLTEASEQMFKDRPGVSKEETNRLRLDYAIKQFKLAMPSMPEALLRALIEAAVYRMKQWGTTAIVLPELTGVIEVDDEG